MKLIENQAFQNTFHLAESDRRHFDQRARQLRAEAIANVISGAKRLLQQFAVKVERARTEHATQTALNGLDDRLLTDIGIVRDQIPAVVKGQRKPGTERTDAVSGTQRRIVDCGQAAAANDAQTHLAA